MKPKCTNMLVTRRHHWPPSVYGPKSAPNAMACCGVGLVAETPRSTMTTNTSTLAAIRAMVTGNAAGERASGPEGDEARTGLAGWLTPAGQLKKQFGSSGCGSNSLL